MKTIVTIAGLIIIALSFVYIMKNPNQSLMDSLMRRGNTSREEQEEDKEPDQKE